MLLESVWAAITEYHGWGSLNNRHLFLKVLEAEKTKTVVLADSARGEHPLPDLQMVTILPCTHMISSLCLYRERMSSGLPS